jgi:hypothetical protein
MGDLSDFERRQIVGARLAAASVIKNSVLLGLLRTTVSKVMSAYMNHGKMLTKMNSGQKSALTERDCHTLGGIDSKNDSTTAQVTVQQN